MSRGPDRLSITWHPGGTISADASNIPIWQNNTGYDWVLDDASGNEPTWTSTAARTGSGSASDGTMWVKWTLNNTDATATDTGMCAHRLMADTTLTANVGEPFDNMTGSSYIVADGESITLDIDLGAGIVNYTASAYDLLTVNLFRGESSTQS